MNPPQSVPSTSANVDVSIIIPIYNGIQWIDKCFTSILQQDCRNKLNLQVCVCNDASTDGTKDALDHWHSLFQQNNIDFISFNNNKELPNGVGYSKNRAVDIASGNYLCFQDIDDIMLPTRISSQYKLATAMSKNTVRKHIFTLFIIEFKLIGSKFQREPINSTARYTKWANGLTNTQLKQQIYTSHGPTIIMPTWFCHKDVYYEVGGFDETGKGTPEDLIFFYRHLDKGGDIARVDEILLIYTYHKHATTFSITEDTIWNLRLKQLETNVLNKWSQFTIWNAGKQGRKFFKSLTSLNKAKVIAFCDVDIKKIEKQYIPYDHVQRKAGRPVDIVHYTNAQTPFVICMKQDLTEGNFEDNLRSLQLEESLDYIYFS